MKSGVLALLCAALMATALPAASDELYPIVFPVVGPHHYTDTYDAPRAGNRLHEATDIMADKMTPVVAAADGTVGWVSSTCCGLQLIHDDGYQSWYIHLNNDTPGTDDGQGSGIAPGIETGAHVIAGQLIGWVGDSGNAENSVPHLHFQLHYPDGSRFNPYQSLLAARHLDPVAADEIFFYREDGLYRYYDIGADGRLGSPIRGGTDYTAGWSSITAVDLNGDGQDEMFFYREDGLYRYYSVRPDAALGSPIRAGDKYTPGWDAITAVELDGDGQDEVLFYREDGLYRYYNISASGNLGSPLQAGDDYSLGATSITSIDLDGDGRDEVLFYKIDGTFSYHAVSANGLLGNPILAGSGYTAGWSSITSVNLDR